MKSRNFSRKSFFALFLFLTCLMAAGAFSTAHAQYQMRYGGTNNEDSRYHPVERIADGSTVMVGTTQSATVNGQRDIYVVRIDQNGVVTAGPTVIGSLSNDEEGHDIEELRDLNGNTSGYLVCGTAVLSNGRRAVYLAKLTATLGFLWDNTYGDGVNDWRGHALKKITNGIAVTGIVQGATANTQDVLFLTTDDAGAAPVMRRYDLSTNADGAFGMTNTTSGDCIVAGYTTNSTRTDGLLMKIAPSTGTISLLRRYGNTGNNDTLYSVELVESIYYLTAGTVGYTATGNSDLWVMKVDATNSNIIWSNAYAVVAGATFYLRHTGADAQHIGSSYAAVGTAAASSLSTAVRYIVLLRLDRATGNLLAPGANLYGGSSASGRNSWGRGLRADITNTRYIIGGDENFNTAGLHDLTQIRTNNTARTGCDLAVDASWASTALASFPVTEPVTVTMQTSPVHTPHSIPSLKGQICPPAFKMADPAAGTLSMNEESGMSVRSGDGRAEISLQVSREGAISLDIYDMRGRRVKELANRTVGSGSHSMNWDGTDDSGAEVPSGVYFARMRTSDGVTGRQFMLVR